MYDDSKYAGTLKNETHHACLKPSFECIIIIVTNMLFSVIQTFVREITEPDLCGSRCY